MRRKILVRYMNYDGLRSPDGTDADHRRHGRGDRSATAIQDKPRNSRAIPRGQAGFILAEGEPCPAPHRSAAKRPRRRSN